MSSFSYMTWATPVYAPQSHAAPASMKAHNHGTLNGIKPSPPQFYPGQVPVNASMFANQRTVYSRTAVRPDVAAAQKASVMAADKSGSRYYSQTFHKRVPASGHMNYIPPMSSGLRIAQLKAKAVGKSSFKMGLPVEAPYSTKNVVGGEAYRARQRIRRSGSAAPPKIGSVYR